MQSSPIPLFMNRKWGWAHCWGKPLGDPSSDDWGHFFIGYFFSWGDALYLISCTDGYHRTLHLEARFSIHGYEVVVLIDGGLTNNFIQSKLVTHLGLTVKLSPHLHITVGNSQGLTWAGECSTVPFHFGQASFSMNLLLLPIYGADHILGSTGLPAWVQSYLTINNFGWRCILIV